MSDASLRAQLSVLAIAEGVSYLMIGATMVLKYRYAIFWPNIVIGMLHGLLFIGYCIWVVLVARSSQWKASRTFFALLASVIPVATFVVEARWLRKAGEA